MARLVEAVAKRYGLDPSIPFGVMVAESNLDPAVTSPAGARGLMQLMPAVGERLHPDLFGDRPFDVDDLYAGPYNAALGTLELGQRTQSLRGVREGSSVLRRWRLARLWWRVRRSNCKCRRAGGRMQRCSAASHEQCRRQAHRAGGAPLGCL